MPSGRLLLPLSAAAPHEFAKDITDVTKNITIKVKTTTGGATRRCVFNACVAVLVVDRSLFFIAQYAVRFVDKFKLLSSFLVVRVSIGMILHGQTTIRFFNSIVVRVFVDV